MGHRVLREAPQGVHELQRTGASRGILRGWNGSNQDRGDALARSVGAALVAEALLLLASRIFTLIYVVANEVNVPDEHRTPTSAFALFLLISIVPVTGALVGGRTAPSHARRAPGARPAGRGAWPWPWPAS